MEIALRRGNMKAALRRVKKKKGAAGVDGVSVDEFTEWLVFNWADVREALLNGTYQPMPVRQVMIPKPGGGQRMLGIPTLVDRLIQQALLQVLQPIWDPTFSKYSYGFRPGRSAHDALQQARRYAQGGRVWVVDVDLAKFFDEVDHDILMGKLAHRINDKRVLGLIRRYLQAGMVVRGQVEERLKGTPQGGPLSPLLANILLDEVDKKLEQRGHRFVRYADDCNVYVRSRRAGERVMEALVASFTRLKLRVNMDKSSVAPMETRKFLGHTLRMQKGRVILRVAQPNIQRMKTRVRRLTRRNYGRSLESVIETLTPFLRGWRNYFTLTQSKTLFIELDQWIRHRLRAIALKQWKRGSTAYRELRKLGAGKHAASIIASNTSRWWRNSRMLLNGILPNSYFDNLGLYRLSR